MTTYAAAPTTGIAGINLPPMPEGGISNNCAFSTKPLVNTYTQQAIQGTMSHKRGIRICINPQTVSDPTQWQNTQNMANWARECGGAVVFCLVDSNLVNGVVNLEYNKGHGDGLVDNLPAAKEMWATVAKAYENDASVYFEAFNEPHGYTDPCKYISAMMQIIPDNIPANRIIIDGMDYAADVQSIKDFWPGLLGYHVYPSWIAEESAQTQSNYSNRIQKHLAGVAHRTMVTEFGANLTLAEDYNNSIGTSKPVQFLKGVHDAFNVLKPKGTFIWHGWNNKDTYSYWSATASAKAKVDALQSY
jgi:hypothetical protein